MGAMQLLNSAKTGTSLANNFSCRRQLKGCNGAVLVANRFSITSRSSSYMGLELVTRSGKSRASVRTLACQPVRASFLGVGAPEAILVGVVALVLFGPKGLAQGVKSLGSTLRAFAPTLRELTAVSTELKNTLEEEIGLNDIRTELTKPAVPPPLPRSYPEDEISDDEDEGLSKLSSSMQDAVDPDIERKRAEAAKMAWGGEVPGEQSQPAAAATEGKDLGSMSIEDLEKELQRRKEAQQNMPPSLSSSE